jgi:AraC-like DNA-binding protein
MNQFVEIGPSGRVRLFGIRFWPAGAHPFFRFPLLELNNRIDDLRDVWDSDVNLVQEQLAEATSFDEGIAIVETALTERLRPSPSDDIAIQVARLISSTAGMARIELIRKSFGISERSLERRFKTAIGTSPKMFSRIIRFQNLLKTLEQQKPESFLDIALSLGYYDQPHMIREFKEFSGKSPIAFLKTTHQISEFFTQTS